MAEQKFMLGDRVTDKRGCCSGTVVDYRESRIGYTLLVDWGDGCRNTQHPDDLIPDVGPNSEASNG